jgi:uncharacterized protein YbjT (DUF2867 family)
MTTNTNSQHTTLLVGGTGRTGSRVARRLTARGAGVRIASRRGTPPFDWDDRTTWAPLLDGVDAAYVAFHPDLIVPGAAETIAELAALAAAAGVQRLVLLSGRGEEGAQRAEETVRQAFPARTVVRASLFAQNFSEAFLLDSVRSGVVALPVGDVREPFVDADDIADVVVAALTADGHAGQVYEVTGPRLMSFADAVADIAAATGRAVAFERITADEFVDGLTANGVPAEEAHVFAEIFETVLDGRNAYLTDGVQRALGRAPRDFTEYAAATAPTGVWFDTDG